MYTSRIILNKTEFKGTLDFYSIKDIQNRILENFGQELSISEIFEALKRNDMKIISTFIIATLSRCGNDELEILDKFTKEEDLNFKFNSMYKYINDLVGKCISSKKESKKESEFEDEEFEEKLKTDWEFDFMEYMWTTILKREGFWETTPKNLFEQMEIYKKINKNKTDSENIEEI